MKPIPGRGNVIFKRGSADVTHYRPPTTVGTGSANTYSKSEIDTKLATKANVGISYSKSEVENKINTDILAAKATIDTELASKADKTYTYAELAQKADKTYADLTFMKAVQYVNPATGQIKASKLEPNLIPLIDISSFPYDK